MLLRLALVALAFVAVPAFFLFGAVKFYDLLTRAAMGAYN
jgi:hypothetical protein